MVFKIPEVMNKELGKVAEQEDRTKAWLIRKAIQKFLEEKQNGKRN